MQRPPPNARWWNALPHDFYRSAVTIDADALHPWKVRSTAAVDVILRTGLATLLAATVLPVAMSSTRLRRDLDAMQFYRDKLDAHLDDPAAIFARPEREVVVTETRLSSAGHRPPDCDARLLRFNSPYEALNPGQRQAYARHRRNHATIAEYWPHRDGPRPTLVFLHGFLADAYWVNSLMFSLRWFWQQGFDVLLVTLPFHGERQAKFSPFSGAGFFMHGMPHMNEAMLQAVFDVRIFIDELKRRGAPAVGISGLSLGGYLSALTASVDDRLAFCVPNAPVVCPADMLFEWAPLSWLVTTGMRREGIDIADLRHALALHCPLTWQPKLPPERLLVIGGAGDRFTAPRYVRQLHHHWAGSGMHWFPGNHVMHLHQRKYLRLMRDFMRAATEGKT